MSSQPVGKITASTNYALLNTAAQTSMWTTPGGTPYSSITQAGGCKACSCFGWGCWAYPLAQGLHDGPKLLPNGLLEVARLGEMVEGSYVSQQGQELECLLWHDFSEVAQQVDCAV